MASLPDPPLAPVLRIASRRSGIDRVWGTVLALVVLVLGVAVGAILFLASKVDDGAALMMLGPVLPLAVIGVWVIARTWRRLRSITVPIEMDRTGLVLRTPQGTVRAPWEAVAGIGFGRNGFTRTVVVRLHPQAGPGAPGIESTIPPRAWRIVRRYGLRYAAWLLEIQDGELAAAVASLSGGRVHVAPAR